MTEEEAKTKHCPFANVQGYGNRSMSDVHDDDFVTCLGSKCMAWKIYGHYAPNKAEMIPSGKGQCGLVK